jgi:predicted PurR-regulated permease PerM
MLAAVLNFIPYLGAAIVIATLFVVGLIVFSALSQVQNVRYPPSHR